MRIMACQICKVLFVHMRGETMTCPSGHTLAWELKWPGEPVMFEGHLSQYETLLKEELCAEKAWTKIEKDNP